MSVTAIFHALGDPTRRAVVEQLSRGPATTSVLAATHAMSLPGFLKHLRVLEDAGVVRRSKSGRVVTCTLEAATLRRASDWLDDRTAFWQASLDRLADLVDHPDHSGERPDRV